MNQPAFPTGIITDDKGKIIGGSNGMLLRDYFAAKTMQGLISQFAEGFEPDTVDDFSIISYRVADSMMKVREL